MDDIGTLETLKNANESLRIENVRLAATLKLYEVPPDMNSYLAPSYMQLLAENKMLREKLAKHEPEELLPCPFCGDEANMEDSSHNEFPFHVKCRSCYCQTQIHETEADAIKAWNTRVK